jgi:hypothetical protein
VSFFIEMIKVVKKKREMRKDDEDEIIYFLKK